MAKKNLRLNRKPGQDNRPVKNPKGSRPGSEKGKIISNGSQPDLFSKINHWLSKHSGWILVATLVLTLVFSILLFDIRFSLAGDDSAYVERAFGFIHHFVFPSFRGPLYPMVLGPFVAIAGISAVPLKALSLVFMLGFIYFMYRAFRDRIPPLVLTITMILLSVNSFILYYASQTYSEAFFMFLQSVTLFFLFKFFIGQGRSVSFRTLAARHLILALLVLCLGLTRPIGFVSVAAIAIYFLFKAEWKNILYFLASFSLVLLVFLAVKSVFWGNSGLMFSSQTGSLLAKDYYTLGAGQEDFAGLFRRLTENSNYYISKSVFVFLGLREPGRDTTAITWLTILVILINLALLAMVYRKNDCLFFILIYSATSLGGIFLITQSIWMQDRLIIPYYPLILLLLAEFFYFIFSFRGWTWFQFILPILGLIILSLNLKNTASEMKTVGEISDKYSGLSPDWQNYCKISEWTHDNLPAGAVVACRKPSISFIYSRGRNFFGITRIPDVSGDSLMRGEKQKNQHFSFILNSSITSRSIPREVYHTFKQWLAGYGLIRKPASVVVPCYVMKFPDSLKEQIVQQMKNENIEVTDNIDILRSWVTDSRYKITFVFTDTLVELLRRSGVTHVLEASLRADGTTKNGNTNNTVERYMEYIRYKYPDFMTRICQMGAAGDEPATLYKVNYDMLSIGSPR